jgi:WD40 repeat protein
MVMGELDPRLETIFALAMEIADAKERAAFVERACVGDETLCREVEALLQADEGAGNFMKATQVVSPTNAIPSEQPGDRIGRYKLLEQIGEGGFGVVWMAEQEEPVRRRVALKIIKLGMDTRQVLARFEAERQALALMEHPNIAKVFDGGATDTGRPFFVMELVKGIPITNYSDANKLSTRDRLKLFIPVCQAVQHAHQKGIIHRDLKPTNILVTEQDGKPMPKVIDFGVAKATQARLTERTLFTGLHQMIGTPAYMSPEQAGLGALDVDTRSDIYALGVLLYELLTGRTPFTKEEFEKAGLDEIFRLIREQDPPKPSTRLSTLTREELTTIAASRHSAPARLNQLVQGELDWIVMKALEKSRARRYETANGFAADIQRHLNDEPVMAAAPSAAYRARKFVRRHRPSLAVVTVMLLLLLAGAVVSTWQVVRATRAEQKATQNLWHSYLAQARAHRLSGQAGRRFDSLDAIAKAARIQPDLALRNEAIAAMGLSDVRHVGPLRPAGSVFGALDANIGRHASADAQGNISIRRLEGDVEEQHLPGFGQPVVWVMRFSPDGQYLAAKYGHGKQSLWIWNLRKKKVVLKTPAFENGPAAFHPKSHTLAVGLAKGSIALYDLVAGTELRQLTEGESTPYNLSFNPAGDRLAVASHGRPGLQMLEVTTGKSLLTIPHASKVYAAAWSPDGRQLASACANLNVYLWDAITGRQQAALKAHYSDPVHVAYHPSGTLLASYGWDGITHFWEPETGQHLFEEPSWSLDTSFSPDGLRFGTARDHYEVAAGDECRVLAGHPGHRQIEGDISPDGRWLASAASDGVRLWDLRSFREIAFVPNANGGNQRALFTADARNLWIANGASLRRFELRSQRDGVTETLELIPAETVGPLGPNTVACLQTNGDLRTIPLYSSLVAGEPSLVEPGKSGLISISPDHRWLATGNWKGKDAIVWDAATGARVRVLEIPRSVTVAFSPDGRWLVTGSGTQYSLRRTDTWKSVWDLPRAPEVGALSGTVTFSHDGKMMALIYSRTLIRLVRTATGEELATLEGSPQEPVCFSPNDDRLVTRGTQGQLHVWNVSRMRQQLAKMGLDWGDPERTPAVQ